MTQLRPIRRSLRTVPEAMLLRPPRIRPIRQETPTTEPDRPFGRLSEPGAPESISSWGRWRVRGTGLWRPGGGRGHMIFKRGPVFDSAGCDGDRRRICIWSRGGGKAAWTLLTRWSIGERVAREAVAR